MKSHLMTFLAAFGANLAAFWIVILIWDSADFAGLVTGSGSMVAVLGLCHGMLGSWEQAAGSWGERLAEAELIVRRGAFGGGTLASLSTGWLAIAQPAGWAVWIYGLVWGVLGGVVFAITCVGIGARLRRLHRHP